LNSILERICVEKLVHDGQLVWKRCRLEHNQVSNWSSLQSQVFRIEKQL